MEIKLYDESDVVESDYQPDQRERSHKWEFIMDLPADNPDLFGDRDNYDMEEKLRIAGVIGRSDQADNESCCSYYYFKTKRAGAEFIKRLNDYISKKGRLVREANTF
jgi:hypothetical protein